MCLWVILEIIQPKLLDLINLSCGCLREQDDYMNILNYFFIPHVDMKNEMCLIFQATIQQGKLCHKKLSLHKEEDIFTMYNQGNFDEHMDLSLKYCPLF